MQDAVALCGLPNPRMIVPIHQEGARHFVQPRREAERVLNNSPLGDRVRWVRAGEPVTMTA